ncbi:MAG: hypothetical protein AAF586_11345 [Planctomycetota bacterium]
MSEPAQIDASAGRQPASEHWLDRADARLRGVLHGDAQERGLRYAAGLALVCCLSYGLCMGSYAGRPGQMMVSAVKVPLLLGVTTALTLPPLLVVGTLLGLASKLRRLLVAIAAAQAAVGLTLAAVAPYTLLWYTTIAGYPIAILFNGAMFAVATVAGHTALRRATRPLVAEAPNVRWLVRLWVVLYAFVGVQMGWVLRPFIGNPGAPVQFFRESAWSNAYVEVWRIMRQVVSG